MDRVKTNVVAYGRSRTIYGGSEGRQSAVHHALTIVMQAEAGGCM
jgi:hypothetical protein